MMKIDVFAFGGGLYFFATDSGLCFKMSQDIDDNILNESSVVHVIHSVKTFYHPVVVGHCDNR
jgi:hypothetical protein